MLIWGQSQSIFSSNLNKALTSLSESLSPTSCSLSKALCDRSSNTRESCPPTYAIYHLSASFVKALRRVTVWLAIWHELLPVLRRCAGHMPCALRKQNSGTPSESCLAHLCYACKQCRHLAVLWILIVGFVIFLSIISQTERSNSSLLRLESVVADFHFVSRIQMQRYLRKCGKRNITPQGILCLNKEVSFQTIYTDRLSISWRCWVPLHYRRFVYRSLLYWMSLAAEHNITWWLTDGSLIGALRHHDVIPFDHDADVMIATGQEEKLRRISVPKEIFHEGLNLRLRPDNGKRVDCFYRQVPFQLDACAFTDPFARIIQSTDYFLDLFASTEHNATHLRLTDAHLFPRSSVFPLKLCQFMNLTVPCPKDSPRYLTEHYPNFQTPNKHCIFGRLWLWRVCNC